MEEVEQLKQKVQEQEKTIELLRRQLREFQNKLYQQNRESARRWREQSDYLPYHEDERD
jgi:uncharacterized coiled-coil protein SlyX